MTEHRDNGKPRIWDRLPRPFRLRRPTPEEAAQPVPLTSREEAISHMPTIPMRRGDNQQHVESPEEETPPQTQTGILRAFRKDVEDAVRVVKRIAEQAGIDTEIRRLERMLRRDRREE